MTQTAHPDSVLIVDFGSQVTQLIARRVREAGVYCEIVPFQSAEEGFKRLQPKAVILSGSPASTVDEGSPRAPQIIFDSGLPVFGICYGQQTMCMQLGGMVESGHHREFGRAFLEVDEDCVLFEGLWSKGSRHQVWMSHGDRVTKLPEGFEVVATSSNAPYAFIADEKRKYYGVQFHPEVVHTPDGAKLIANFIHNIAGIKGDWTMSAYRQKAVEDIRKQVGDKRVICALSGGVDSSVAALLIHEAVGDQLTCILVDHGLMRKDEAAGVVAMFREHYNLHLIHVDASDRFIGELEGVSDPETKRKIIGRLFIETFEDEAKKLGGADFLGQGTLYPDVIESVSFTGGPSVTIKSHHNVGGLPERMNMKLVEPLRELFKDEVRRIGVELGLPREMVYRHPFPGPGLGVRVLGEVKPEYVDLLQRADNIFIEELRAHGLYDRVSQAFAVFLPVRSVGVVGDGRAYEWVIALRAVETIDFMTAHWAHLPYDFLDKCSTRIINELRGISRVVYDISGKPPATIEWE